MSASVKQLRAVVAVPLEEQLCQLIEEIEPRLEVVRDHELTRPARGPGDWSGDPGHVRSSREQSAFDAMVDSADALFGIPDVEPRALARTARANDRLKWVMTTAAGGGSQVKEAGLSTVELERIVFTTSAGAHGAPLAEFALMGILAGVRNLPKLMADKAHRRWGDRERARQIDELTVLVVRLGGIGAECARQLSLHGARVWGINRSGRPVPHLDRQLPESELGWALSQVDAVVCTLPGTARTHHLIDAASLARAKEGLIVVNVGRGTVIDETALLEALDASRVGFAALDVFEVEPLPVSSPLWEHPSVLISPHTAALNGREAERIARQFADNATRLIDGRPLRAVVDTVEYY